MKVAPIAKMKIVPVTKIGTFIKYALIAAPVIVLILFIAFFYFLPTFIARKRNHKNTKSIFLINFLFGFTFLGWVAALIWALNSDVKSQ